MYMYNSIYCIHSSTSNTITLLSIENNNYKCTCICIYTRIELCIHVQDLLPTIFI